MDKAIVKIKENNYEVKFTVGFWKKVKEVAGITIQNLEAKLNEDFGTNAGLIIHWGIFYGSNVTVSLEEIEAELDASVKDVIEQAIINGMTKAEKRLVEIAKKRQEDQFIELESKKKE